LDAPTEASDLFSALYRVLALSKEDVNKQQGVSGQVKCLIFGNIEAPISMFAKETTVVLASDSCDS
jgi:hypothetical protein